MRFAPLHATTKEQPSIFYLIIFKQLKIIFVHFYFSMQKKTEEPKPTLNCPRLNGYFAHKGTCDKFFYCVDGMFNMIMCPAGLVFNPRTGTVKFFNRQ